MKRMHVDFNPFDPQFHTKRSDLYEEYRRLRGQDPVHRNSAGLWFVTRYADAATVLQDHRFGKRGVLQLMQQSFGPGPHSDSFGRLLFFLDPPEHRRVRALLARPFTSRTIAQLRGRVQGITDELVDRVLPAGRMDVIEDFAYRLPLFVVGEILGVPPDDNELFIREIPPFVNALDPVASADVIARGNLALEILLDYFQTLVRERLRQPRHALLDRLIAAGQLTEDELISSCLQLLNAGYQTSADLIGNGTLALLRQREQWDRLVANPALVESAVEEVARYDASVQIIGREAFDDVAIGGELIPRGSIVFAIIGSANRDPERYDDPDQLDITRPRRSHLAFGAGVHVCLGAALARMELQVTLATFASRLSSLELDAEITDLRWRPVAVVRGLESLPVRFPVSG